MAQSAPGLDELGRFVNRRELESLQPLMAEGETVRYATDGTHAGRHGLLAATDRRILFVTKALLRRRIQQWEYDAVVHVGVEKGIDAATVTIDVEGGPFVLTGARKDAAAGFLEAVRPEVSDRTFRLALVVGDPRNATPVQEGNSTVERLRRLERMRARRSITEPEYKVNRRRILEDAGLPTDLRKKAV